MSRFLDTRVGVGVWLLGIVTIPIYVWVYSRLQVTIDVEANDLRNFSLVTRQAVQKLDSPQTVYFVLHARNRGTRGEVAMWVRPQPESEFYKQTLPEVGAIGDDLQSLTFTVQLGNAQYPVVASMPYDYRIAEQTPSGSVSLSEGRIVTEVHWIPGVDSFLIAVMSALASFLQIVGAPGLLRLFARAS